MYAVYILYSSKLDKYYIGYSADVVGRLRRHNSHSRGYTCAGKPWILVYSENYENKSDAEAREKQLKKWKNRTRLEDLIITNSGNYQAPS
jgi:putative endonuclease